MTRRQRLARCGLIFVPVVLVFVMVGPGWVASAATPTPLAPTPTDAGGGCGERYTLDHYPIYTPLGQGVMSFDAGENVPANKEHFEPTLGFWVSGPADPGRILITWKSTAKRYGAQVLVDVVFRMGNTSETAAFYGTDSKGNGTWTTTLAPDRGPQDGDLGLQWSVPYWHGADSGSVWIESIELQDVFVNYGCSAEPTPTATPVPCDYAEVALFDREWGVLGDLGGTPALTPDFVIVPGGSDRVRTVHSGDCVLNSGEWSVECEALTVCEWPTPIPFAGEFSNYPVGGEGSCGVVSMEARPEVCQAAPTLQVFGTYAGGAGLLVSDLPVVCPWHIDFTDLPEGIKDWAELWLGVTTPVLEAWSFEVCFQQSKITALELGPNLNLLPYVLLVLAALAIVIIAWIRGR